MSRFGSAVRELRFHLCQTSRSSLGVRDFIDTKYVELKKNNPNIPILIRECTNAEPRLWVRYEKGVERFTPLKDLKANDVMKSVETLTK